VLTVPLFHEHRVLCQVAGHGLNVVKALPSLVVGEDDIRGFAAALEEVVAAASRVPSAMASFGWRMARQAVGARR
jgi:ornithine--oxo-acid transaminase